MAKSSTVNLVSSWAFLIGVVLAVILGALAGSSGEGIKPIWTLVLVVIGIAVGLINVTGKEANPFLLSGAVLILASSMGSAVLGEVPYLNEIFEALLAIFVPSTIIVAIKNAFMLERN